METIKDFDLSISYTPGKANVMADALSRKSYCNNLMIQESQPALYEEFRKLNLELVPQGYLANLVITQTLEDKIRKGQLRDICSKNIKENMHKPKYKSFSIDDQGTLFFQGCFVVLNDPALRNLILKEAHDTPLSINPGSTKMYLDIKSTYWWTRMKRDVARYVSECDACRRVKAEHQRPAGVLQPLKIPEWKWDKIEMDFVTGFPKSQKGNDAIFVVIDRLSKVAHFLPVKETISASQLADLYTTKLFLFMVFPWK
jgi:hypothetical protein